MTRLIKVYGERNTNTNYIGHLIELNLHAREVPGVIPGPIRTLQHALPGREWLRDLYFALTFRHNLGWKHSCVRPWRRLTKEPLIRAGVGFITLTKNPYSWLLSLHRRPYHRGYRITKPDFATFLTMPWPTVGRDNLTTRPANPIELWNLKNRSYLGLDPSRALNITVESLLESPAGVIEAISRHLGVERTKGEFVNHERSTKEPDKTYDYYRDYYLNERWRAQLSADTIGIINRSIDSRLMERFGYEVLA